MVAALVVLVVGFLLVWMALPRTIAYATLTSSDKIKADLSEGKTPSPRLLLTAISSQKAALAWVDLPDAWIDMGSLYLALARRPGLTTENRTALLDRSQNSFERGLTAAPSRPFAWAQLAQVHHLVDPASPAFNAVLRMSVVTGPHEPRLISQRVRIGYAARSNLSSNTGKRIDEEIRIWAKNDAWRLADWARPHFALPWVRRALKDRPALDGQFLANYLRLPPR